MSKNFNALVLEGEEVKLRLQAERTAHKTPVHVDWLRFTVLRRNAVPTFESNAVASDLKDFPSFGSAAFHDLPPKIRDEKSQHTLNTFRQGNEFTDEFDVFCQALDLAKECCAALGADYYVGPDVKPGKDFYKWRWCIQRAGHDCGWVGFLTSKDSPSQASQAQTIHANIEGHGCTFADFGWCERFADLIDLHQAKMTRVDLALDFFDGANFEMACLKEHYLAGVFDVRGRRPMTKQAGDWFNGAERSLYIGCRNSGKETNIYEKGDQLFGREANSPWIRIELRYGNKLRVLESDILRRPADFFAGASDWHALQIAYAGSLAVAQKIPQEKRLEKQTVFAEVRRNIRWALTSAAPTIAAAFKFLPPSEFLNICDWETKQLPGRLKRFNQADLSSAFERVMGSFFTVEGPALPSYHRLSMG